MCSQDAWERKNDFLYDNGVITSFSINGKGYLFRNNNAETLEIYSYDPATDTYEQKNNFPIYKNYVNNFVVDNKAYVMYYHDTNEVLFMYLFKYNENEDNWDQMSSIEFQDGESYLDFYTVSINDKGYILLTGNGNGNFREYDTINDIWVTKEDSPIQFLWADHSTFSIGDIGYVAFGDDGFEILPVFYSYNQLTDTWSQLADVPYSGFSSPSFSFTIGDYGYLGIFDIGTNYFKRYSQTNNSWENINRCPNSISSNGIFNYVINGKAYVGTRNFMTNENKQVWMLDPELLNTRDYQFEVDLKLYPNPTGSILNIESKFTIDNYTILDLSGRQIMDNTTFNNIINVSSLNPGTYILKLGIHEYVSYHYFIKK